MGYTEIFKILSGQFGLVPGMILFFLIFLIICFILLINGVKCLLRAEMLRIYYHNRDKSEIRQYEKENFLKMYKVYRLLLGNSFIKDIYEEDVVHWEVIT